MNNISIICDELLGCGKELLPEKQQDAQITSEIIQASFKKAAELMIVLKRSNRDNLQKLDEKEHNVEIKKDNVGKAQLRLENLLYQQAYLLREIKEHQNFASTELNIIEKEVGVKIGMDNYSDNLSLLHKNSLLTLKNELQLRKTMRSELIELLKTKETVSGELDKKRKYLETYPEKVAKIRAVASSLFSSSTNSTSNSNTILEGNTLENIRNLPNPLYTLYYSLTSAVTSLNSDSNVSKEYSTIVDVVIVNPRVTSTDTSNNWSIQLSITILNIKLNENAIITNVGTPTPTPATSTTTPATSHPPATSAANTEVSSAAVVILFEYDQTSNLVHSSISAISFFAQDKILLSPPSNVIDNFLSHLFPGQSANFNLDASRGGGGGGGGGAYLWAQWICGLRTLPPPGVFHSQSDKELQGGDISFSESRSNVMFYSLNSVFDMIKSRLVSVWRLGAIINILLQSKGKTISAATPYPLPSVLQMYYQLCMKRLALSTSQNYITQAHPCVSHPVTSEVVFNSIQQCNRPLPGLVNDPFTSSSFLDSTNQMDIDDFQEKDSSTILRLESTRQNCVCYKASFRLNSAVLSHPSTGTSTPATSHSESVAALIEISPEYPLQPPYVLLTNRKLNSENNDQVDNMLKGIEQEFNAGCVNFLEVQDIARFIEEKSGEKSDFADKTKAGLEVSKVVSSSFILSEAMDNILLLQMSVLLQMCCAMSSVRARDRALEINESSHIVNESNENSEAMKSVSGISDFETSSSGVSGRQSNPSSSKVMAQDRRGLLANFYGRNFLS